MSIFGGGSGIRTHAGLLPNGFQDRLVMTTSISLRKYDALRCIIFTESVRCGSASLLVGSTSHTPLEDRQACLSGVECGYLRHRRTIPFDAYCAFFMMHFVASYLRSLLDVARRACSSDPLRIPHSKIDKLACQA